MRTDNLVLQRNTIKTVLMMINGKINLVNQKTLHSNNESSGSDKKTLDFFKAIWPWSSFCDKRFGLQIRFALQLYLAVLEGFLKNLLWKLCNAIQGNTKKGQATIRNRKIPRFIIKYLLVLRFEKIKNIIHTSIKSYTL